MMIAFSIINLIQQLDHEVMSYIVVALGVLVAMLVVIMVILYHQIRETRRLSSKLEKMMNEVLSIEGSDFSVRKKNFK